MCVYRSTIDILNKSFDEMFARANLGVQGYLAEPPLRIPRATRGDTPTATASPPPQAISGYRHRGSGEPWRRPTMVLTKVSFAAASPLAREVFAPKFDPA